MIVIFHNFLLTYSGIVMSSFLAACLSWSYISGVTGIWSIFVYCNLRVALSGLGGCMFLTLAYAIAASLASMNNSLSGAILKTFVVLLSTNKAGFPSPICEMFTP